MIKLFSNKSQEPKHSLEEFVAIYDLFRDYIKSEDHLINSRMTWMLTIHGFLYATFGFTIQKFAEINEKIASSVAMQNCKNGFVQEYLTNSPLKDVLNEIMLFLLCICVVGSVISITAWSSVSAAYNAASSVRVMFERYRKSTEESGHFVYKISDSRNFGLPLLTGGGSKKETETRGYRAAWSIPTILLCSWIASALFLAYMYTSEQRAFLKFEDCAAVARGGVSR